MKMLFVHDHVFYKNDNELVYSAAAFPSNAWERYLKFFSNITVIGRFGGIATEALNTLVLSSKEGVSFVFVKNLSSLSALLFSKSQGNVIRDFVIDSDAVVVRLPSENGLNALKYCRKYSIPYAIEVVGCVWDALWNYGSITARLYAPIAYLRMRYAIRNSKRILYVTDTFLQKRYPANPSAETVNASNVFLKFDDYLDQLRLSAPCDSGQIKVGLIGNYKSKYKGIDVAIKALRYLGECGFNLKLYVLGKGNPKYYVELSETLGVRDKVEFCGSLPNGKPVLEWLDKIDYYIQPSYTEGLPRSLIEAMARGKICLGSDVGGIPELLGKEFIHSAGDWKGLALSLISVIKHPCKIDLVNMNYNKAKLYEASILDARRCEFYSGLAEYAHARKR